jgi:hypothetical protein
LKHRDASSAIEDALTVDVDYTGYDALPDYKTVAEWREAMKEEAEAGADAEGVWIEEDPRYREIPIRD